MTNKNTDYYAVIGNPISHSLSPLIHSEFAKQTNQDLNYSAKLVEIGQVRNKGKGLNITVPFKLDAFNLATELSPRAQRAGAVNTLILKNSRILGDTTDGIGLLNDLKNNHQQNLKNKHILVVGAGGAVRGVLEPLLLESPASLVIANRTLSKAEQLARDFADFGDISARQFEQLNDSKFDLIINGTSASLSGNLPPLANNLFAANACAYDMMYAKEPTVFMQWAQQQGVGTVLDGLGMLVEQAAEAFYLWRDKRPKTQDIIHMLKTH